MPHVPGHLLLSVAAFAVTLGFRSLTVNRLVKRKLRLSLVLLVGSMAISLLLAVYPFLPAETAAELRAIQNLALAAALINVSVLVAINPLRLDRVPDRFPAILQDFIVIGLVLVASTFFSDRLLTTSAVSAVVLGFALQDTLGNAFAGLAIQSEKPFHVGHWVRVGEFEGRVEEVTWRATKLRTKSGQLRRPAEQPRLEGSDHQLLRARRADPARGRSRRGLPGRAERREGGDPRSAAQLVARAARPRPTSSWSRSMAPRSPTGPSSGSTTTGGRRGPRRGADGDLLRLPAPQHRNSLADPGRVPEGVAQDPDVSECDEQERLLAGVDLLAPLPPESRHEIAASAPMAIYGNGETIVRQGEAGQSMFVVCSGGGRASCSSRRARKSRASSAGGYFGEMSLLTGEPRSATVLAVGDVTVVEIGAELFRRMAVGESAGDRRDRRRRRWRAAPASNGSRTATAGAVTVETNTLLARMKKFLRLSGGCGLRSSPVSALPATQLAIRPVVSVLEPASDTARDTLPSNP